MQKSATSEASRQAELERRLSQLIDSLLLNRQRTLCNPQASRRPAVLMIPAAPEGARVGLGSRISNVGGGRSETLISIPESPFEAAQVKRSQIQISVERRLRFRFNAEAI